MKRVELGCHTGYSRTQGIGSASQWVRFAVDNGIDTLVINDCGNVDGTISFAEEAMKKGQKIKLIMGCDLYIEDDRTPDKEISNIGRLSVLIRNETGKKNLYRILSAPEGQTMYSQQEKRFPLSLLLNNRDDLLIGSGTEESLFISSCFKGSFGENISDTVSNDFDFLDYIEIPCHGLTEFGVSRFIDFADRLHIPAVVVSTPHYMIPDESLAFSLLTESEINEEKHYQSTEALLEKFSFLGKEKAYEVVVANSRNIADRCEAVPVFPLEKHYPCIPDKDEILYDICLKALSEKYPNVTMEIEERLNWELSAIRNTRSASVFLEIRWVMKQMGFHPWDIGLGGYTASSLVGFLLDISEVDPIKEKLTPYFLFGYKGEKKPEFALYFGYSQYENVQRLFKCAPGIGSVAIAGTDAHISQYEIEQMVRDHKSKTALSEEQQKMLVRSLSTCVREKACDPGKILLFPDGIDPNDICPLTYANNGTKEELPTTGFSFLELEETLYTLVIRPHEIQEELTELSRITGTDLKAISIEDPDVMSLFIRKRGHLYPSCAGLPDFCSFKMLTAMEIIKPRNFNELVRLRCLMHGTNTWSRNANKLLLEGTAPFSEIPVSGEELFYVFIQHGIDEETSYQIADAVKRGKIRGKRVSLDKWAGWKEVLQEHHVAGWLILYLEKVSYMFSKAGIYSATLGIWRLAWFKVHYPLEFYLTMLNTRYFSGFITEQMAYGRERLEGFMACLLNKCSDDDKDVTETALLLHDFYDYGFSFKVVEEDSEMGGQNFFRVDDHTIGVRRDFI